MRSPVAITASALAFALAACGGGSRAGGPWFRDGPPPEPLGPTFSVTSADEAPVVFPRATASGAEVRYVFRREASPTDHTLRAVVIERALAYAVGDAGAALRRTADGGWELERSGTDAALRGIAVATFEGREYAYRRGDPRAVPVYAVGDGGAILRRGVDGTWEAQTSPTSADLHAIAATAAELIAVGDAGTVLWLHSGEWREVDSHVDAALRSVALSTHAAVIVGDGGTIVECRFPGETLACVPRPSPTDVDLRLVAERTVRWDHEGMSGFTIHELAAFGADGTRLTRATSFPIELVGGRTGPFPVHGYAGHHFSYDVIEPEDVAVGPAGHIALVDPYAAWVPGGSGAAAPDAASPLSDRHPTEQEAFDVQTLPEGVDLRGVAFEGLDGFVVGDEGTILQLTVEGAHLPVMVFL